MKTIGEHYFTDSFGEVEILDRYVNDKAECVFKIKVIDEGQPEGVSWLVFDHELQPIES